MDDMTETLRVLAGDNAGNAARHFSKWSYDLGDVASAVHWASIASTLDGIAPDAAGVAAEDSAPSIEIQLLREGMAFEDAWFEDVDAETLVHEERLESFDPPTFDMAGRQGEMDIGFEHAAYAGAPVPNSVVEAPRELVHDPAIAA